MSVRGKRRNLLIHFSRSNLSEHLKRLMKILSPNLVANFLPHHVDIERSYLVIFDEWQKKRWQIETDISSRISIMVGRETRVKKEDIQIESSTVHLGDLFSRRISKAYREWTSSWIKWSILHWSLLLVSWFYNIGTIKVFGITYYLALWSVLPRSKCVEW